MSRETKAIIVAVGSLAVAVLVTWLFSWTGWEEPGTGIFLLLLLTVVVYLIVSGRITELRGLGGLEAKFTRFIEEPAAATDVELIDVEPMGAVKKAGVQALDWQIENSELDVEKPFNLIVQVGEKNLVREDLLIYLDRLGYSPHFMFVLLQDNEGELIGYGRPRQIATVLRDKSEGRSFVRYLNHGSRQELRNHYAVRRTTLSCNANNREALEVMARCRLEAVVVVDGRRRPVGYVERDQLVTRLLLAIS